MQHFEPARKLARRLSTKRSPADSCWKRFEQFFPLGFRDPKYMDWERGYKWAAHEEWQAALDKKQFLRLLNEGKYQDIASIAIRIESRTNLLFSFEKMALRDGVRTVKGAEIFSQGLYRLLHGRGTLQNRFDNWCEAVSRLPRKQTRVLTHPVATVFPFIADPKQHVFVKPKVLKAAAAAFGFELHYESKPSWRLYSQVLMFADLIANELKSRRPLDMIDIQSFMWVIGSDEYERMLSWKQRPAIT
jgi:hypothetical protein